MRIGEIILKYRAEHGLSLRAFADRAGVSRSYINTLENDVENKRSLTLSKITGIAQAMGMTSDDLIAVMDDTKVDLEGSDHRFIHGVLPVPDLTGVNRIPVLGTIACGSPVTANQEYEYLEIDEMIKADFCVRAKGDSMIDAGIRSGSIVLCRYSEQVENGQIAAVSIDDEVTLKKFYSYGDTVVLRPCNPDFHEQVYTKDELNHIHIIGKAVTCISSVN